MILVSYPAGSSTIYLGLYTTWDQARKARDRYMASTPGFTFDTFDFEEFKVDEDRHGHPAK